VRLLLEAGIPKACCNCCRAGRNRRRGLVGDDRVKGVMFTGSTEVARLLQRNIAGRLDNQGRPIPLIAETGGQNAMIVDSSALTEQVVIDVVSSASTAPASVARPCACCACRKIPPTASSKCSRAPWLKAAWATRSACPWTSAR
jgi:delta 1-pyrroline-5-carboxylate dehydrogenase